MSCTCLLIERKGVGGLKFLLMLGTPKMWRDYKSVSLVWHLQLFRWEKCWKYKNCWGLVMWNSCYSGI